PRISCHDVILHLAGSLAVPQTNVRYQARRLSNCLESSRLAAFTKNGPAFGPALNCCDYVTGRKSRPRRQFGYQVDMALTRFASLETLRLAVFLCIMPFCAVRTRFGSAAFSAASA